MTWAYIHDMDIYEFTRDMYKNFTDICENY